MVSSANSQDSDLSTISENASDEVTSYLGLPLLGIYYQLREYPPHTFVNPRMLAAEAEIENILSKVDKLLKPLGLGRHTIERILGASAFLLQRCSDANTITFYLLHHIFGMMLCPALF